MSPPLERGTPVAWAIRSNGKTVGVSYVHRVNENGKTFCNHKVPGEEVRFDHPLPPFLGTCSRCEKMATRALTYDEQQQRRSA